MPKRPFILGGLIAVLVLIGMFVQRSVLSEKPATPAAAAQEVVAAQRQTPPAKKALRATLKESSGTVEVRDAEGNWRRLHPGQQLKVDDVIRTAPNCRASLVLGENVVVEIAEATTLSVKQVSRTLSRVALDDGRVVSKVQGKSDFRFRVEIRNSKAVAETASGEFGVLKRGSQPTAVAAKTGSVDLRSERGSVKVNAGEMSTVSDRGAPAAPSKIPSSLFLKFAPAPMVSNKKKFELKGTTTPGASVVVAGRRSTADARGKFTQRVALKQGENEILVVVEDPLGRRASAAPKITVRAGPKVEGEVQW